MTSSQGDSMSNDLERNVPWSPQSSQQMKHNSQLLVVTIFQVDSFASWREPEQIPVLCLVSTRNWSFGSSRGHLYSFASLGSPDRFEWVSPGSQLSHIGWWSWVLFGGVWQVPAPSQLKDMGMGRGGNNWKTGIHTHPGSGYWMRLGWKILRNTQDTER